MAASASTEPLGVFFHSNRPLRNGTLGLVGVAGWRPLSPRDTFARFKRADGATHPYHFKFGVAQSAKYDWWFDAVREQHGSGLRPPYVLTDTDTVFQCTADEMRARFNALRRTAGGADLVVGAEHAWFPKRDHKRDPWPMPALILRHDLLATKYPQHGLRYPNSGAIMATRAGVQQLSRALAQIDGPDTPSRYPCCPAWYAGNRSSWCHIDDQHCLQSALQQPHARVRYVLDANASLFLNLAGVPAEHLVRRGEGGEHATEPRVAGGEGESSGGGARCVYAQTGVAPCVLHANGKMGKTKMAHALACAGEGAWAPQISRARRDLKPAYG